MNINLTSPNTISQDIPNHNNILITEIDTIAANICTNVIINQTLNYVTYQQIELLLSKIRHGGTIVINSIDTMELAKALYWGKIDLSKFSELTSNTVAQHSIIELKTLFERHGYIIDTAHINVESLSFTIKVRRP